MYCVPDPEGFISQHDAISRFIPAFRKGRGADQPVKRLDVDTDVLQLFDDVLRPSFIL